MTTRESDGGSMMGKEPIRTLRCDDRLWKAAQLKAAEDGMPLSAVIRKALAVYAYGEPCTYDPDAYDPR